MFKVNKHQIESTIVFVLLVLLIVASVSLQKEVILNIDDNGKLYNVSEYWAGGGGDEIAALVLAGLLSFPAALFYFSDFFIRNRIKIVIITLTTFIQMALVNSILDYEMKYINVVHGSFRMRFYIIVFETIKLYVIIKIIIKMKRMADNR